MEYQKLYWLGAESNQWRAMEESRKREEQMSTNAQMARVYKEAMMKPVTLQTNLKISYK